MGAYLKSFDFDLWLASNLLTSFRPFPKKTPTPNTNATVEEVVAHCKALQRVLITQMRKLEGAAKAKAQRKLGESFVNIALKQSVHAQRSGGTLGKRLNRLMHLLVMFNLRLKTNTHMVLHFKNGTRVSLMANAYIIVLTVAIFENHSIVSLISRV
jgi:hypothetical protein